MKPINISILGCCVSRDVFEYANTIQEKKYNYIVNKYVHFVSNYSATHGVSFSINPQEFVSIDISDFRKRCICLDIGKKVFDFLWSDKISDFFIYDFANTRLPVMSSTKGGIVFTQHIGTDKCMDIIKRKTKYDDYNALNFYDLPEDEILKSSYEILDNIKEKYDSDHVILNLFYGADSYITKSGTLKRFPPDTLKFFQKWNGLAEKLKDICVQRLNGCHIISAPENLVADSTHHFGLHPMHYNVMYYEYATKAMEIIMEKYNRVEEEYRLEMFRQIYSEKFACLRRDCDIKAKIKELNTWKKYSAIFEIMMKKGLFQSHNEVTNFEKLLFSKNYVNIAIYGNTVISRIIVDLFTMKKNGCVNISYIVENLDKSLNGIRTIDRSAMSFPLCDVMLIADIYSEDDIKEHLKSLGVVFPYYGVEEFINLM